MSYDVRTGTHYRFPFLPVSIYILDKILILVSLVHLLIYTIASKSLSWHCGSKDEYLDVIISILLLVTTVVL